MSTLNPRSFVNYYPNSTYNNTSHFWTAAARCRFEMSSLLLTLDVNNTIT